MPKKVVHSDLNKGRKCAVYVNDVIKWREGTIVAVFIERIKVHVPSLQTSVTGPVYIWAGIGSVSIQKSVIEKAKLNALAKPNPYFKG